MQNSEIESSAPYIDQVYDRLLQSIALGELKPGERVRQSSLAERLGVSRQPVSHALQLLKHQGLVREAGKQGVQVAPVDPGYIVELYAARSVLEHKAALLAAGRVASGAASADQIDALNDALAQGRRALGHDAALPELVRFDFEFHLALYRLSGNPVIESMMLGQWPHLMRSMMAVLEERGVPTRAWEEHARITAFILAGEAESAAATCTAHLERASREWDRRLQRN